MSHCVAALVVLLHIHQLFYTHRESYELSVHEVYIHCLPVPWRHQSQSYAADEWQSQVVVAVEKGSQYHPRRIQQQAIAIKIAVKKIIAFVQLLVVLPPPSELEC